VFVAFREKFHPSKAILFISRETVKIRPVRYRRVRITDSVSVG